MTNITPQSPSFPQAPQNQPPQFQQNPHYGSPQAPQNQPPQFQQNPHYGSPQAPLNPPGVSGDLRG